MRHNGQGAASAPVERAPDRPTKHISPVLT